MNVCTTSHEDTVTDFGCGWLYIHILQPDILYTKLLNISNGIYVYIRTYIYGTKDSQKIKKKTKTDIKLIN